MNYSIRNIKLKEEFNIDTLRLSSSANKLIKKYNLTNESILFTLDFEGIVYVSRCFCQELFNGLVDRVFWVKNADTDVRCMMEFVVSKMEKTPKIRFTPDFGN